MYMYKYIQLYYPQKHSDDIPIMVRLSPTLVQAAGCNAVSRP